jgi:hypothetical protein
MKILKDLAVSGQITVGQLLQSSIDTDKFLVAENGVVKFRTGSEILSDIGGISGNQNITLSGDASGSGTTAITVTLANSGVTAGTYNNVTVDAKGRVTAGSNVAYLTSLPSHNHDGRYIRLDAVNELDGVIAHFRPATSGGYTMMKFESKVNQGSDYGWILMQDDSANTNGAPTTEDVRMTIGVFNDFQGPGVHSDELWFQGGARLVQNVGSWDSEYNTIIGTPAAKTNGTTYEWRINNSPVMAISFAGVLSVGGNAVLHASNYNSYSPTLTGVGASGTWGINITGNAATATTASNSSTLNGISVTQIFNNMGNGHGTYTNFNSVGDFGVRYIQGTTNGPNTGASQYYGFTLGLGSQYPLDGAGSYASQFYWGRTSEGGSPYVSVRFKENNSWGTWSKIWAGYADTAGALSSMNISQFTNNSGYLTAESDTLASVTGRGASTSVQMLQNGGRFVRDSHYRTISGVSDYYGSGSAGWYKVAQITLTGNCSGAVLFGTLNDNRYDGADAYQISVVARAECSFTSNNEDHYINVGASILGSTNYTNYRDKVRVLLVASSSGSRTYELQFYETPWNHDTWELQTTGWTIYSSPQAPGSSTGTARVNYISKQNSDYYYSNVAMYVNNNTVWHAGNDGSGSGLDADLLDGLNSSTSSTANTIVARDSGGDIYGRYVFAVHFNASCPNNENPSIAAIWTNSGSDNYLRKSTPAHFTSQLGLATQSWVTSQGYISGSYLPLSGGTLSGNLYIQSGGNPSQLILKGTNSELYVDSTYGGGTSRIFINRQSASNQATLHFTTAATVTNGSAWNFTGGPLWTMGMTNSSQTSDFKIAYGDIYDAASVAVRIDTNKIVYFTNTPYVGGNIMATQSWVTSQGYLTSATVTINSGNGSAAWYPIVWHSGNTLYSSSGLAEIYPAGGYARFNYINTSDNDESGITRFVIKNGDNYHRSATTTVAADVIRGVASGTWSISISGNASSASQVVNNTDGAVLMESNASENNNWLWKENAKQWGLFWFNRGTQSGQTIGSYSTVGAETMFMGGSSGIDMPSGWTGYIAGSKIAAMISNWNGYIYSASTVFAAGEMRAPIFYDSDNISYYLNPAGSSRLRNLYIGDSGSDWSDPGGWGTVLWLSHGPHSILRIENRNDARQAIVYSHQGQMPAAGSGGDYDFRLVRNFSDRITLGSSYITMHTHVNMGYNNLDYVNQIYQETGGQGNYIYANNSGSYGSMRLTSTRNGWYGIYFDSGSTLMMNSNETGFYRQGYGWQWRWENGTAYVNKNSYGGGTSATVLDSSNFGSWAAPRAYITDSFVEFTIYGDQNTYYPVTINNYNGAFSWQRYTIHRGYSDTAPWNPIGTGVHHGGLTFSFEWAGDIAWGGNDKSIRVIEFNENYTQMVAGMQLAHCEGVVVWLRGGGSGGAYYRLHGPGGRSQGYSINMSSWTSCAGVTYSPRSYDGGTVNSEINSRYPIRGSGSGDIYVSNQAVIHSGNIGSQSVSYASSAGNADTVDGYHAAAFPYRSGGSSGYYQVADWLQFNTSAGLYWPGYYGAHFYPNDYNTYGQFRINGSKNSYGGIVDSYSGVTGIMYDSSGNGGVYREANGRWYWYHHVGNNCTGISTSSTSSSYRAYIGGSLYAEGDVVAYSDARKKTDIFTIDNALEKVTNLRGVYYTRIDDVVRGRQTGVIAQEIKEILPEVVTYAADVDEYGVSYGNIVGVLIEAIKEQQIQIEDLKKQINSK